MIPLLSTVSFAFEHLVYRPVDWVRYRLACAVYRRKCVRWRGQL